MERSRPAIFAAVVLIVAALVSIAVLAPRRYLLHRDTAGHFWACFTQPPMELHDGGEGGYRFVVDGDRVVYCRATAGMDGEDMNYQEVLLSEAGALYPTVARGLEERAGRHFVGDFVSAGYARWKPYERLATGAPFAYTMRQLLACVDAARDERGAAVERPPLSGLPAVRYDATQMRLVHVAAAARWYWAAIVFEAVFFPGLIWFAFWPWIEGRGFGRKVVHVALLPLLMVLPAWLGYGSPALGWGPGAGILYSVLNELPLSLVGSFGWEKGFLEHLPPVLSVISAQDRGMLEGPRQWRGLIGPVNVAVWSSVAIWMLVVGRSVFRRVASMGRPARGFPVEEVEGGGGV